MSKLLKLIATFGLSTGLVKMPVVRQVKLKDNDLVALDDFGNFKLSKDGHLYIVKEKLSEIVKNEDCVCLKYLGETKYADKEYMKYFRTFNQFKKDYEYIKKGLENVK